MREFDHDGLLLAEYQGKLFERSTELGCSSAIFLRRFLHSDLVKKLDKNDVSSLTLDVTEGLQDIQNQFGEVRHSGHRDDESALILIIELRRVWIVLGRIPVVNRNDGGTVEADTFPGCWCLRGHLDGSHAFENVAFDLEIPLCCSLKNLVVRSFHG